MNILLLNADSSSLKCTLMESAEGRVVARGLADWAGSKSCYRLEETRQDGMGMGSNSPRR